MIANSGHDERGAFTGGKAGDQTGGEWQIQKWYSRPWTHVFRYPSRKAAELIAELAKEAANNNLIGYDQSQRTTFWQQLTTSGYHPANIKTACEADCSAGVAAIVKAAGMLLNIDELKSVSKDMYTGSQIVELTNAGFNMYTDPAYLRSDKYLMPGDILLCKGHHTAINLSTGVEVEAKADVWRWVQDAAGEWYYQNQNGQNRHNEWSDIKETYGPYIHRYYFDNKGKMLSGYQYINGELYLFQPVGPLKGAQCRTDSEGHQKIWNVDSV